MKGDVKLLDVVGFWECCYGTEYVFWDGEVSEEEKDRASGKKGADEERVRMKKTWMGRGRMLSVASG